MAQPEEELPIHHEEISFDKGTVMGSHRFTATEKTQAQKNCEAAHTGQAGYCDSAGTWHPSNAPVE